MARMAHILLISRCPPWPLHLGDRLIIWHLARELAMQGYKIDLLAFANQASDHDDLDHYRARFDAVTLLDEPARPATALLRRLLLPGARFPQCAAGAGSPAMWRAIEAQLASRDYICAHFFGGIQVYEYRHAAKALPALITPYESYSLYLRRALQARSAPAPGLWLRQRMAQGFEAWMFAPFGARVVVSERDREELRHINPALEWEVIPNGVECEEYHAPVAQREAATLLFTGNFAYAPNLDAAEWLSDELLPALRRQGIDARLWLVGHAPPESLRARAGDHVLVTGHVPDLRPWLARATVYVCPLRLGAGIRNKVLEALAAGCPLLATPLSVEGIALRHGEEALLAEREDFAAALRRLLADAALRERLARAGRRLVETNHGWNQVAARYAALYRSLAAGQERP